MLWGRGTLLLPRIGCDVVWTASSPKRRVSERLERETQRSKRIYIIQCCNAKHSLAQLSHWFTNVFCNCMIICIFKFYIFILVCSYMYMKLQVSPSHLSSLSIISVSWNWSPEKICRIVLGGQESNGLQLKGQKCRGWLCISCKKRWRRQRGVWTKSFCCEEWIRAKFNDNSIKCRNACFALRGREKWLDFSDI